MSIILGKVEEGAKIGRQMGYPTINIPYSGEERGVFVGKLWLGDNWHVAAVHIGERPTINSTGVVCESFLLDFDDVVEPGTDVKVELKEKIRDVVKFDSLEALTEQIGKDVEYVKNWFNSVK